MLSDKWCLGIGKMVRRYALNFLFIIIPTVVLIGPIMRYLKTAERNQDIQRNKQELRPIIPDMQRAERTDVTSKLIPLYDFKRYPCLAEVPIFKGLEWSKYGKCVRTVNLTSQQIKDTKNCVSLKTPKGTLPICLYTSANEGISRSIYQYGVWEVRLVKTLANVFISRPGLEFLDVGCNIGVYTLSIAQLGIKVTAIDTLTKNFQLLSQSIELGKLQKNITLIWNAVSDEHKIITFQRFGDKVGRTQIKDISVSQIGTTNASLAGAITLDDLVPLFKSKRIIIKMDIEQSEYNALLGGKYFFDQVDVVIIQMEIQHQKEKDGPLIINFLSARGFRAFNDIHMRFVLDPQNLKKWPSDVYFIKT